MKKESSMPRMTAVGAKRFLRALGNPDKAAHAQRFFRTGKGEYGEGDRFLGVTVPEQRRVAKQFRDLPVSEMEKLLDSPYHEDRFTALEILVMRYERADAGMRPVLAMFYLQHADRVNNWDLVDTSAPYVLGHYLYHRPEKRKILLDMARSVSLWERRIAIVSTLYFIRHGRYRETLGIVESLLGDREDLMHKASGWMLREVWKRDARTVEKFLDRHVSVMPRTMLRYAIERMPEEKRKEYLGRK